jgi:hypothetical protein
MSKMTATVSAKDLCSTPIRIRYPFNMIFDLIIKAWPTTSGIEFRIRFIKGVIASAANKSPYLLVLIVFSGKRALRSFVHDDLFFFLA